MEKFIVSARKYRPQNFALVVGQEHITTTLKNAIQQNTLAHAFLFCGPRGVGKTTCARILAKTINCENLQPDGEACNNCNSCTSFNQGASLNIHELDAASNNSVDDIRELVAQVRFAPQEGKYKVYIIDEVHMLSAAAFNAFLKTLEEPPAYAKFILATTEKHKILPTILSRCQIFDFKRITNADTVAHLEKIAGQENIKAEKAALQLIAQKSEGCMRDALSILDKIVAFTSGEITYHNTLEHLNLLDEDHYFKLLQALLKEDLAAALLLYDGINAKGFEGNTVLEGFAGFLRNLMVCKDERAAPLLDVLEGMQEQYAAEAKNTSLSYLVSALNVVNHAIITYREAQHKRLHVELCLIKLCYLQQAISLVSDGQGQVVKKRTVQAPVAMKERPVSAALLVASRPADAEAKLSIQSKPQVIDDRVKQDAPQPGMAEGKPQPRQPEFMPSAVQEPTPPMQTPGGVDRNKLLSRLKQKVNESRSREGELETRVPVLEEVLAIWNEQAVALKAAEKHTIASALSMAQLAIDGGHGEAVVVATVSNKIQQRLLEMEATTIVEKLRQRFNNVNVNLVVDVNEAEEQAERKTAPHMLSAKERYELMIQHYPLVKELKDALKLDLGYS